MTIFQMCLYLYIFIYLYKHLCEVNIWKARFNTEGVTDTVIKPFHFSHQGSNQALGSYFFC